MTTEALDRVYADLVCYIKSSTLREIVLLTAVKAAYRKHCLDDDSIGWDELSEILLDSLCEVMGDDGYQSWVKSVKEKVKG